MRGSTHKLTGKLFGSLTFIGLNAERLYKQYEVTTTKLQAKLENVAFDDYFKAITDSTEYFSKTYWSIVANSIITLLLLRLIAKATSVIPDYDQKGDAAPGKDSYVARLMSKTLDILGAHHRSRHTHSIDLTFIICGLLIFGSVKLTGYESFTTLAIIGLSCGLVSHIITDMFNSTGVHPTFLLKANIAFVPKKVNSVLLGTLGLALMFISGWVAAVIGVATTFAICIASLLIGGTLVVVAICCRGMTFTTGGQWEDIFFKAMHVVDVIISIIALIICFI